jgi:hypothetical protein
MCCVKPCAFHVYPLRMECVTPEMEWTRVVAKIAILADKIAAALAPRAVATISG